MKECSTQSRSPLRCFSFWLPISVLLSMVTMSAIAQTRSPGSSNILPKRGDQSQYSFTSRPAYPEAGEPVQFADSSLDQVISWEWDFGDGKTSDLRNPRHFYSTPGFYRVTLTTHTISGSRKIRRTISVMPPSVASFSYSPATPKVGQPVKFIDMTSGSPTSWQWRFGDGTTSTAQNPTHAYNAAAPYTVTLVADGISGAKITRKTLIVMATASAPSLISSFTHSPASPAPGQAIQFTDTSTGSPTSWHWDFNDGLTSTDQNPNHTFTAAGTYNVTVTITNEAGSSSASVAISVGLAEMIRAASPLFADVNAAVSRAKAGDTVIVPAGSANWGTNNISTTKALSIIGAGIGQTIVSGGGSYFFAFLPDATAVASDGLIRVSGFTLNGNYAGGASGSISVDQRTSSVMRNFIVDHVSFYHCIRGIALKGNIYGVAYSCHFEYTDPAAGPRDCSIFLTAIGNDRESWDDHHPDPASPYGHSDNFFIEDCTFEGNHWCEAGHGGRYVIRHNTFNNFNTIQAFDVHGNQPGNLYGTIISEIYENTFTNVQKAFELFTLRGGYALLYNNVISGVPQAQNSWIKLRDEYDDDPASWPVNESDHEIMRPRDNYSWGNRANSVMFNFWEAEDVPNKLAENLTFWNEMSSFNGKAGVGVGPLSSRPATCSTGVAYWATDTQTLYRATAPNTWSVYYRPYTYPHPLRNQN